MLPLVLRTPPDVRPLFGVCHPTRTPAAWCFDIHIDINVILDDVALVAPEPAGRFRSRRARGPPGSSSRGCHADRAGAAPHREGAAHLFAGRLPPVRPHRPTALGPQ